MPLKAAIVVGVYKFGPRLHSDMPLEAAIVVCIYEWSKIQNVNKGDVERSLTGSWICVIGPMADLYGFLSINEIATRQRKYRLSNAREIRKYFGN